MQHYDNKCQRIDDLQVYPATIEQNRGGTFVHYYGEDRNGDGFEQAWYGPTDQCQAKLSQPAPQHGWFPIRETLHIDAATATGMYDE